MNNVTTESPLTKLIRSSIYIVNGQPVRYTGEMQDNKPVFHHHHGDPIIVEMGSVNRANKEQINAYLGR